MAAEGGEASFVGAAAAAGGVGSLKPPGFEVSTVDCLGAGSGWESNSYCNVLI